MQIQARTIWRAWIEASGSVPGLAEATTKEKALSAGSRTLLGGYWPGPRPDVPDFEMCRALAGIPNNAFLLGGIGV